MNTLTLNSLPMDILINSNLVECYKQGSRYALLFEGKGNYILLSSGKDISYYSVKSYAILLFNRRVREIKQDMSTNKGEV
jgi:hypothetical protein